VVGITAFAVTAIMCGLMFSRRGLSVYSLANNAMYWLAAPISLYNAVVVDAAVRPIEAIFAGKFQHYFAQKSVGFAWRRSAG
jgi:exosortase/archaeosortase